MAIAATAVTSALAQQPHPNNNNTDRPHEFSCPNGRPLDFTRDELEQRALEEIARKGRKPPAHYTLMLKRWGCDWWVFLLQEPSVPGADSGVLVDGISGLPKQYVRR